MGVECGSGKLALRTRYRSEAPGAGRRSGLDDRGQSLLEFLLLLPMLVGFSVMLVKVNTAIQLSIVSQKYARAQALWLTFNSPIYPEQRLRADNFVPQQANAMIIGVSSNPAPDGEQYSPEALTQLVSRTKALSGGEGAAQSEENERGVVRIRNTVTLCTQSNVIGGGGKSKTIDRLSEGDPPSAFAFCRSPFDE